MDHALSDRIGGTDKRRRCRVPKCYRVACKRKLYVHRTGTCIDGIAQLLHGDLSRTHPMSNIDIGIRVGVGVGVGVGIRIGVGVGVGIVVRRTGDEEQYYIDQ